MPFAKTLNSADLVRMKEDANKFPPSWKRVRVAKDLCKLSVWKGFSRRTIEDWLQVVTGIDVEDLHYLDEFGKEKLGILASIKVRNPSHKGELVKRSVEEGLTTGQICRVRDYYRKGRSPDEAIKIAKGAMPEKSVAKKLEGLSLSAFISEMEKTGKYWRKMCQSLRTMGKIQVVENGKIFDSVFHDIISMKVEVEDVGRYVDGLLKDIPPEIVNSLMLEYRGELDPRGRPPEEELQKIAHREVEGEP